MLWKNRLHKLLLQPRGVQPLERKDTANPEQVCPLKVKRVVGKVRVEGMLVTRQIMVLHLLVTQT